MEPPETYSWEELQARLTRIMADLPSFSHLASRDPCALKILRLRDIAEWCGMDRKHLYFIRRGERTAQLFTPAVQRKLSWFFQQWDAGKLVKERQVDGKWRVGHQHSQPQAHADEAHAGEKRLSAQVSFLNGTLRVLPK